MFILAANKLLPYFQLQRLIQMVLENLSSLFESLIVDMDEKGCSVKLIPDQLDEKIPSICKFQKLAGICNNNVQVCSCI